MNKTYLMITLVILLSSCASIVSSSSSIVGVDTEPQGANVEIRNRKGMIVYNGRTPATLHLKHASGFFRKAVYQVKLSMDGYQPKTIVVDSHLNAWYFGNVLFGGFVGMLIIDPMTGAMYKLDNTEVDEKLLPIGAGTTLDPGSPDTAGSANTVLSPTTALSANTTLSANTAISPTMTLRIVALKDVPADRRKDLVRLH